jgi:ABC-type transport system involved in multi-copper enzyme maturation permease subunit
MRQFLTIAGNAFMELVRQPVFLLLMSLSAVFEVFLSSVYYFAFGDEPRLVKNSVLAVMMLAGLLGAVLSASASLAREIRSGTALAVLSKPVGRAQFLLAKFAGLAAALTVMTYVNTVAALVASRLAFDAYGGVHLPSLAIFFGSLLFAYLVGGFSNYFLRRPFVSDATFAVVLMVTVAAFFINQFTDLYQSMNVKAQIDWRLVPASVLILFALWILAAVALTCSTRLDMIPTLAVCTAVFMIGLMSDYLFGRRAEPIWKTDMRLELQGSRLSESQKALVHDILSRLDKNTDGRLDASERSALTAEDQTRLRRAGLGGAWWASVLYTVTPNWQLFWLADILETGKTTWDRGFAVYVGKACGYMAGYVGAVLALGIMMFENRELS